MTEAIYPGNKTKWRLYRAAKVDAASTVSDDLDQATALCEQADDAGQAWLYPCPQRVVGRVADAQPYVLDVIGFMSGLPQPACERRWQLGIDQKLHLVSDKTA